MFEMVISPKRGRWEWIVCDRTGKVIVSGRATLLHANATGGSGYGGYIRSRLWLRVRRAALDFVATIIRFLWRAPNLNSACTPWANSSSDRL